MNQMRVRIDKSRQDNPASDVQRLSRPRCGQGLYLGACTYGDDAAVVGGLALLEGRGVRDGKALFRVAVRAPVA